MTAVGAEDSQMVTTDLQGQFRTSIAVVVSSFESSRFQLEGRTSVDVLWLIIYHDDVDE